MKELVCISINVNRSACMHNQQIQTVMADARNQS